ncbi:MAG: hypothetical protein ACREGB_01895 [Candidatus Saccharimonadales bacterium]
MSKRAVQFNCFSSPVMLATFAIETILAAYTVWRYKFTPLMKLVTMSLLALGFFQLAEYHVCTGGEGLNAADWSRAGFVAITLLPPLGLHILHVLANKKSRWLIPVAYTSMIAFVSFFLFSSEAFDGYACTGNYVIFQIGHGSAIVYGLYYYGWLLAALLLGARWANQLATKKSVEGHRRLEAVRGLMVGYLVFLVPTAAANTINPETRRGIPSVMCGFAVLFALILTLYILPRLAERRR